MTDLVGRVEQLLEQGESHRIDEHVIREGLKYAAEITAGAPVGINPEPGLCALDRLVAAVNLVEPLARDWQRLKRIEEAARLLREAQKSGSAYGMVASRTQDLDLALAAVSSEEENDAGFVPVKENEDER